MAGCPNSLCEHRQWLSFLFCPQAMAIMYHLYRSNCCLVLFVHRQWLPHAMAVLHRLNTSTGCPPSFVR
eukprot:1157056-Pelagomonas_calceolata.AAC.1